MLGSAKRAALLLFREFPESRGIQRERFRDLAPRPMANKRSKPQRLEFWTMNDTELRQRASPIFSSVKTLDALLVDLASGTVELK